MGSTSWKPGLGAQQWMHTLQLTAGCLPAWGSLPRLLTPVWILPTLLDLT